MVITNYLNCRYLSQLSLFVSVTAICLNYRYLSQFSLIIPFITDCRDDSGNYIIDMAMTVEVMAIRIVAIIEIIATIEMMAGVSVLVITATLKIICRDLLLVCTKF